MSLLDEYARPCIVLKEGRAPDGAGGWTAVWTEGAAFTGCLARDTSLELRRAEREGTESAFTVLVGRDAPLKYGDYFRDQCTGETYRVTSRPEERQPPTSAALALKCFTAERGEPPV